MVVHFLYDCNFPARLIQSTQKGKKIKDASIVGLVDHLAYSMFIERWITCPCCKQNMTSLSERQPGTK